MKYLLLGFSLFLLTGCGDVSLNIDSEDKYTPELKADTLYYYWPNDEDYKLIYEVTKKETTGLTYEFPRISNIPDFHPLYRAVNTRYEQEANARAANQTADNDSGIPWDYSVAWLGGSHHPQIWSLAFEVYEYAGGAHPNHWTDTLNYDPKNNRALQLGGLFKNEAYLEPLAQAVKAEVIKAKQKRFAPDTYGYETDTFLAGVNFTPITLSRWVVASQEGEKGLLFFFPPYDIGAYAEGGYEVFISNDIFSASLKPEYKSVFQ